MTDYQMRDSETGRWQNASLTAILMHEFGVTESEIEDALEFANDSVVGRTINRLRA